MARTNRKDGPPPPPSSVDALDDLNLDDMFEGGDDSLFDGLDIDLDGMGDITGADEKEKSVEKEKSTKDLDDIKTSVLDNDVPAPSTSKRRKTKRKVKTPPPPLEEEETEEEQPKKKRKSKSTTKKKSKSKSKKSSAVDADTMSSPERPTKSTKSKSKKSSSMSMPPPLPRGSSGGVVAAAGQFGGRQKQRGSFNLPMSRASADRTKKSKSRALTSSGASSTKSKGRPAPPPIPETTPEPPKLQPVVESTFCGLKPSDTLFYPFLPCLPSEPGMKKVHKLYPVFDKIQASFTGSNSSSAKSAAVPTSAQEAEVLFRLLVGDTDVHASTTVEQSTARKSSLSTSIVSSRKIFSEADKSRVVSDLHSVCALLKRQFDFLNTSLGNMDKWCKNHFSEADYAAVYGPAIVPQASNRKRKASAIDAKQGFKGFSSLAIKVKVKFPGFKEPKMSGPLVASLPAAPGTPKPHIVTVPPTPQSTTSRSKSESTKPPVIKKRKTSTSSATVEKKDAGAVLAAAAAEETVPYANLKPSQRRQRILDSVTRQAHALETKFAKMEGARGRGLMLQAQALNKAVEEDPLVINNTTGLWQWVEKSSYFSEFTMNDINGILHCAWQPEMNQREMFWGEVPPVHVRTGKRAEPKPRAESEEIDRGIEEIKKDQKKSKIPAMARSIIEVNDTMTNEITKKEMSLGWDKLHNGIKLEEQDATEGTQGSVLFDRLSCLLVEEDTEDEDTNDDADEDSVSEWIRVSGEKAQSLNPPEECSIVDLSQLSLDEKTYLQLESIGLVDTPMFSSLKPNFIEIDQLIQVEEKSKISAPMENGHHPIHYKNNKNENDSHISDVIRAMQDDLSDLHRLNNSRTALVRSMAISHLKHTEQKKKKEDEYVSLITRHDALLKKQKESKRSARQKSHKKSDEDWVPW